MLCACGGASFYSSSHWVGTPTSIDSIKVFSEHHDRKGYREVGFVTASGGSFQGAVDAAKETGAEHGCVALGVETQSQPTDGPGSAWGATKTNVRFACLVKDANASPPAAPTPTTSTCVPACRSGYDCVVGTCVVACNPACKDGETCKGHGADAECVTP